MLNTTINRKIGEQLNTHFKRRRRKNSNERDEMCCHMCVCFWSWSISSSSSHITAFLLLSLFLLIETSKL